MRNHKSPFWNGKFLKNPHVRLLAGWLAHWSVYKEGTSKDPIKATLFLLMFFSITYVSLAIIFLFSNYNIS